MSDIYPLDYAGSPEDKSKLPGLEPCSPKKDVGDKEFAAYGDTVPDIMRQSAELWEEKNKIWGPAYLKVGEILNSAIPNGKSVHEWNRDTMMSMLALKMCRIGNTYPNVSVDSLNDLGCYSFMLIHLMKNKDLNEE